VELVQIGAGVEAELLDEVGSDALVNAQCLGAVAGAVQSKHELYGKAFVRGRTGE